MSSNFQNGQINNLSHFTNILGANQFLNANRGMMGKTFPEKYVSIMELVDDVGRDIKQLYVGNKSSQDRVRKNLLTLKQLTRECMVELEKAKPNLIVKEEVKHNSV
ncbi:hypothetical protein SNEBB_010491 [Seison nebaliae]|nr:hypothetical protein SNEBB_010491 [Seison nebaliae]